MVLRNNPRNFEDTTIFQNIYPNFKSTAILRNVGNYPKTKSKIQEDSNPQHNRCYKINPRNLSIISPISFLVCFGLHDASVNQVAVINFTVTGTRCLSSDRRLK